ncbi:MAG: hypothetical protein MJZ41_15845 [Bacteroidaceae bacterium]|nr:hypothetical protein [Bacteroidaceae bacterium]
MKQTLLNKYMKGESSTIEERKLLDLLLETPQDQLSQDERTILELLSYSEQEEDEEDIFAVDYTDEYDKVVKPTRTIRMWPWAAAACVAGVLIMFLMPPKTNDEVVEDRQIIAKVEPQVTNTTASQQAEKIPENKEVYETVVAQKQSKATSVTATAVSQPTEEAEPDEEPVQMSEETRMELLMACLSPDEQMPREIDTEEEIRQMRIRGERMINKMKTE